MEQKISSYFLPYRQSPDAKHLDVLDGFRAIFVFLVAWFHIWQQSWLFPRVNIGGLAINLTFLCRAGYVFVDGLLLLSGFLLYLPYAQSAGKAPRILPFYKRRLIRILPSYLLCVLPMFVLGCFRGQYADWKSAAGDLAAHLTFTFNLFPATYFSTPINGALWTLAVEMQFYLIFPLLARCFKKAPGITYALMAGAAFAFRWYAGRQADSSMYFNQLPAFLDVYANGFAAAGIFTALRKKLGAETEGKIRLFFTVLLVLCAAQLVHLLEGQAAIADYEEIRQGQMDIRFALSAVLGCMMLCASFSLTGVRFLLGNRVMRFLASVSFQFYIYHQLLAVQIRTLGLVPSSYEQPWAMGDYPWQLAFTLVCFFSALLLATLITYLFEQPIARRLRAKTKAEK